MIQSQCSICRLTPERLTAVNNALADANISLVQIARTSGLSKSALSRHWHHSKISVPAAPHCANLIETDGPVPTKRELLSRLEMLWTEATEGLQAAKEPITLKGPDGSDVEVKAGDLRAMSNFLREARQTLEMEGDWLGHFPSRQQGAVWGGGVVIVVPGRSPEVANGDNDGCVEIALPRR